MHVGDTIFIFCLALIIFGPKKLPEIGRQIGKLMVEFRRASNEFKMQIEEELRASDEAERQKEITAATTMLPTAASTAAPLLEGSTAIEAAAPQTAIPTIAPPTTGLPVNRTFDGVADRTPGVIGAEATAGTCAYEALPSPPIAEVEVYPEAANGFNAGLNTASNALSPEAELMELPGTTKPQIGGPESAQPAVHHG